MSVLAGSLLWPPSGTPWVGWLWAHHGAVSPQKGYPYLQGSSRAAGCAASAVDCESDPGQATEEEGKLTLEKLGGCALEVSLAGGSQKSAGRASRVQAGLQSARQGSSGAGHPWSSFFSFSASRSAVEDLDSALPSGVVISRMTTNFFLAQRHEGDLSEHLVSSAALPSFPLVLAGQPGWPAVLESHWAWNPISRSVWRLQPHLDGGML